MSVPQTTPPSPSEETGLANGKHFPLRWIEIYLRVVGYSALLAFAAALMPAAWIISITEMLRLETFPEVPVAIYLARHLSLLYGFIGCGLIAFSYRLDIFRDFVGWLAWAVIALGVMQGIIDLQSQMPLWWTAGESISTVIGGLILRWLDRRCAR
ncbi:hypothetical protein LOC67_01400 [Stieleria sp. JC731]|nr:hypothetical protein [Stieleria sp. JC731]MCC9599198.1 hypothetical protein [Stieleria sp. JC731]